MCSLFPLEAKVCDWEASSAGQRPDLLPKAHSVSSPSHSRGVLSPACKSQYLDNDYYTAIIGLSRESGTRARRGRQVRVGTIGLSSPSTQIRQWRFSLGQIQGRPAIASNFLSNGETTDHFGVVFRHLADYDIGSRLAGHLRADPASVKVAAPQDHVQQHYSKLPSP